MGRERISAITSLHDEIAKGAIGTSRDRDTMGRAFALLFGAGGVLALLTLALPHSPNRSAVGIIVPAVLACAVAVTMLVARTRLPLWAFQALPSAGALLATLAVYYGGDEATVSAYATYYFWVVLLAFFFLSVRAGLVTVAAIAVLYAIALEARQGVAGVEVRWIMSVVTLLIAGLLIAALRGRLERVIGELRRRARQQDTVAQIGARLLTGADPSDVVDGIAGALAVALDVKYTAVFNHLPNERRLLLRAGTGWEPQLIRTVTIPLDDEHASRALAASYPWIDDEPPGEEAPRLLRDRGISSALTVAIGGKEEPFGVLAAYGTGGRRFRAADASFLHSVANVLADALERRRAEREAHHQTLHDPLTGRPNQTLFVERLTDALSRAEEQQAPLAVCVLDIDDFKLINDGFGHRVGDELLKALSSRIQEPTYEVDTLARLGNDEFAILCERVSDERDAAQIAERLLGSLEEPFEVAGEAHRLTATVGVVHSSRSTEGAEALMGHAAAAMQRAKRQTRGSHQLFDESLRREMHGRVQFESALRSAPEREELRLVYQPIVSLDDGRVHSCEALLRWDHSGLGPVSPAEFIPVAEESGAILELGEWVLREACERAATWRSGLGKTAPLPVHVNVSPRQLAQVDFAGIVGRALARVGARPQDLAFEITEHALLPDPEATAATLEKLRSMGAAIVLDDFGTGSSSLSHLKAFPIDTVKIDRLFVSRLNTEPRDAAIVAAVIAMADAFGLNVVAEGIETPEQVKRLVELGCRLGQGFHFAHPMPPEALVSGNRRPRLRVVA